MDRRRKDSSWEKVSGWYSDLVGKEGHYYHRQVILPGVIRLLDMSGKKNISLLDVGCGDGVLSRTLPEGVDYAGMDASASLIKEAKQKGKKNSRFLVADATKPFPFSKDSFTHATLILCLQNMPTPERVFANISQVLAPLGKLIIVLNHPCFRIAKHSDWQVDPEKMIQHRRVSAYMKEMRIPLLATPSLGERSRTTLTYHYSLSQLMAALSKAGFVLTGLEEWCSDKRSTGRAARMENRARSEIPLFMALSVEKSFQREGGVPSQ